MKRILFLVSTICTLTLVSCGHSNPPEPVSPSFEVVDKNISIYQNQEAIIRYHLVGSTNSVTAISQNTSVITIDTNDTYNQYIFLSAFQRSAGSTTVTLSVPDFEPVVVNVTVKTAIDPVAYSGTNFNDAVIFFDEQLAKSTPYVAINKSISGLTSPEAIINYSELYGPPCAISAFGETSDYFVYVISYLPFADTFHESDVVYQDIINVASYLRNHNRTSRSRILPIDSVTQTMTVSTSEGLWLAVEHGYRPVFTDNNSTAAQCYNKARDICSFYIDDDMNNFKKIRAIYEWISENTHYNYWTASITDDREYWAKYTDYYLEGPLLHGCGVCDGFSKTFSLLAGIEQIDTTTTQNAIRAYGYNNKAGGHAWNLVSPDSNGTYYLTCTTWGQEILDVGDEFNPFSYPVSFTSYMPFLTKNTYFYDLGGITFSDDTWRGKARSNVVYTSNSKVPAQLDTYSGGDFFISSSTEANALLSACKSAGLNSDFALCVVATEPNAPVWINDAIASKYSGAKKSVFYYDNFYGCRWIFALVDL